MKTTDTKGWRFVAFTFEERRNYPRFPFNAEILIKTAGAAAALQARTIDLGRMGCRVETDRALPLGSAVTIRICTMSSTFEAEARVIHDGDGDGVAFEFTSVDSKQTATLYEWLNMLTEEAPLERFATRAR
jgi:hypothetical protein